MGEISTNQLFLFYREIEISYITDNKKWSTIKCHFHSIVHHKGRIKKINVDSQLNKLGIVKIYNRSDILLATDKSSFFSAIPTCKTRLNTMLLSRLIVLFENVLLHISFLKKFVFSNLTKRRVGFFFLVVRIIKDFFQLSEENLHIGDSHI